MEEDQKESRIEEEEDLDEEEQEAQEEPEEENLACHVDTNDPQVSLAAMTGLGKIDTFKTYGTIRNNKVFIMIDPGSTLNIVDRKIARKLSLHVDTSERFPISVPSHNQIMCEGVIRKVELKMGDYMLKIPFYVTDVGGVDIVIGVQWLMTIGTYSTNHIKGFLKF